MSMKKCFFYKVRFFIALTAVLTAVWGASAPVSAEMVVDDDTPPAVINRTVDADAWRDFRFAKDAKLLEVWMPDIRDADAAVIMYDGDVWMLDCGDEKAALRTAILLNQLGVKEIGMLFNSHPHHDHLDGLWTVNNTARVEELLVCFPKDSTESMIRAMQTAEELNIVVSEYKDEDQFLMGDGEVSLTFWQKVEETASMNDQSAQTMLRYGERSMLFMADMERHGQRVFARALEPDVIKADIIKYPHHGKLEMADECLLAISPKLAVITNYRGAGRSRYYLGRRNVEIVYTNRDSVFTHLVTDGKNWIVEYVPIETQKYP